MALPRKRALAVRTYVQAAAAAQPAEVLVPWDAAGFAMRARTAATTLTVHVAGTPGEQFTIKPDEVYAESDLVLDRDLVLQVTTDVDTTIEVRSWRDNREQHQDDLQVIRDRLDAVCRHLERQTDPLAL